MANASLTALLCYNSLMKTESHRFCNASTIWALKPMKMTPHTEELSDLWTSKRNQKQSSGERLLEMGVFVIMQCEIIHAYAWIVRDIEEK